MSDGPAYPLGEAMSADATELSRLSQELRGLARDLGTPDLGAAERDHLSRECYRGQGRQAFLLADILAREPELRCLCGVDPAQLFSLVRREAQLLRIERSTEQIESDALDGKLLIRALLAHHDEKARELCEERLADLPPDERLALLGDLAALSSLDGEERASAWSGALDGAADLLARTEEAESCLAYHSARQALARGERVDGETLAAAQAYLLKRQHRGEKVGPGRDLAGRGRARGA